MALVSGVRDHTPARLLYAKTQSHGAGAATAPLLPTKHMQAWEVTQPIPADFRAAATAVADPSKRFTAKWFMMSSGDGVSRPALGVVPRPSSRGHVLLSISMHTGSATIHQVDPKDYHVLPPPPHTCSVSSAASGATAKEEESVELVAPTPRNWPKITLPGDTAVKPLQLGLRVHETYKGPENRLGRGSGNGGASGKTRRSSGAAASAAASSSSAATEDGGGGGDDEPRSDGEGDDDAAEDAEDGGGSGEADGDDVVEDGGGGEATSATRGKSSSNRAILRSMRRGKRSRLDDDDDDIEDGEDNEEPDADDVTKSNAT